MERGETKPEHISSPEQYWNDKRVVKGMLQYFGVDGDDWRDMVNSPVQYLTIANFPKLYSSNYSPASSLHPSKLPGAFSALQGMVEINQSHWQKVDTTGYPARTLLTWDVERYNEHNPAEAFQNPQGTFHTLEPIYELFQDTLKKYDIPNLTVMTGRGYHFQSQIPSTSEAMKKIVEIGGTIEPTVLGKQQSIPFYSKRNELVPQNTELAYKGAIRLQQFMLNKIINKARRTVDPALQVEISDKGERGIEIDNTMATRTVDTATIGALGSLYFIKSLPLGNNILTRVPRSGPDFSLPKEEVLEIRKDFEKTATVLGEQNCAIPDGSGGLIKLIAEYEASPLRKLHCSMDTNFGEDPKNFGHTYRQYEDIIKHTKNKSRMETLIKNANPLLLQPDNLDFFIFEIFNTWGGSPENTDVAPHVAGLLRAIYEDPRYHWRERWTRHYDAFRHARGWTEIMLGQMYEEK